MENFKVIIAGGRNFKHNETHYRWIEKMLSNKIDVEFVSGEAAGADQINWIMAERTLGGFRAFPALWEDFSEPCVRKRSTKSGREYNALAGFNRNEVMAQYADALIIFPGGNGTRDMLKRAETHNLLIRQWKG